MTSHEVAVRDSQLKIVPPSPPLPCLSAETSETGFFVFFFSYSTHGPREAPPLLQRVPGTWGDGGRVGARVHVTWPARLPDGRGGSQDQSGPLPHPPSARNKLLLADAQASGSWFSVTHLEMI